MKERRYKGKIAMLLCVMLVMLMPMTVFAETETSVEKLQEEDSAQARLSIRYQSTPFGGTQASWYNVYKGTEKRSQKMDAAFISISTNAMALVVSAICGLSSISVKNVASSIISAAIGMGFGASSNLYYTVAHYQNKNNPFQEKQVIKYYADKSYSKYLYQQIIYAEKTPLS